MTDCRRFVVLRHETPAGYARPPHWDLMLETGDVLRTWALAAEPQAGRAVVAEQLADHRLGSLAYEGLIWGGRGEVKRWGQGVWELVREAEGELVALVRGEKLVG